ncbi:MAG: hypothetical protein AAF639_37400 [Chloroflexota bacterium]
MDDLTLLQTYEPVVCFTEGELFFPCAVDGYLARCRLWQRDHRGKTTLLAERGTLTPDRLVNFSEIPTGYSLYLQFVDEPLRAWDYRTWSNRPDKPKFQAPGRLARVGLVARIIDALYDISLIIRGTVPGGTTAAADIAYREMLAEDPSAVYYGRVVREGGYIVLHYLFFYVMNNWRSGFHGVNDHEADWEQILVYLSDEETPKPLWVAYASHDFSGDDLRRRWDDPSLEIHGGTHPIVYAGAGSHASYFKSGEYLMDVELAALTPIKQGILALRGIWTDMLAQGLGAPQHERVYGEIGDDAERLTMDEEEPMTADKIRLFNIPFIDYARGDGLRIGPGQQQSWSPILLAQGVQGTHGTQGTQAWAVHYRGLWGLDTRDIFGGERAPSGPKHNRDGSVRQSWHDPLGWSGLDKVTPPAELKASLEVHIEELETQRTELETQMVEMRADVRALGIEVEALQGIEYLVHLYRLRMDALAEKQIELQSLNAKHEGVVDILQASRLHLEKIKRGERGDPQAHIQHRHDPEPPLPSQTRLLELWAAVSAGLLLLVFTLLLLFDASNWLQWGAVTFILFIAIEAFLDGRMANLLLNVTIGLAILTTLVMLVEFFWVLTIAGLFALISYMIWENLRELRMS